MSIIVNNQCQVERVLLSPEEKRRLEEILNWKDADSK